MTRIGFMGDLMIGRLVNEKISQVGNSYVWGNTLNLLKEHDLNIANLETTLTTSEKLIPKVFNFKANPKNVEVLKTGNIHLVNLANNHILDFSKEGLRETIENLDKAGIKHVGAGKDENDAIMPSITDINGLSIGVLGCTDNEPQWQARANAPGVNYVKIGDLSKIKNEILKLRVKVDILIISIHWGPNMIETPSNEFIDFAHRLIDLGVDIIHGHSAHVVQGVEIYKKKLILYDTGDFIDDYMVGPSLRNDYTFLFRLTLKGNKIKSLQLIPCLISNFQVNIAEANDASQIIKRIKKLSFKFGTVFKEEAQTLFIDF